jgi:hypothetical protein
MEKGGRVSTQHFTLSGRADWQSAQIGRVLLRQSVDLATGKHLENLLKNTASSQE